MKQKILTFWKDKQLLKLFIYMLSARRNFYPIVSVYFLMLPNTAANMIGIFTGIGFLLGLILEIPSGYISDIMGHKRTLIVSKLCAIISVICYILGGTIFIEQAFILFCIASIFQSGMFSFDSGTIDAFFHDILEERGQTKEYTKLLSKMRANISLISILFILILPFTTKIDIFFPFLIALCVDIIGLAAITLVPNIKAYELKKKVVHKSIIKVFNEAIHLGFLPIGMFTAFITGLIIGHSAFRSVYMTDLGLPLIWLGSVMALSRFFWFLIGHYIHLIEKYFTMKQHFFMEIFIFSGMYFIVALFPNMYLVGFVFALTGGYQWARGSLINKYIFDKYTSDNNYKATILSIKGQLTSMLAIVTSLSIGYVMNINYQLGFFVLGCLSIVGMSISYYFIFIKKTHHEKNI